MAGKVLEVPTMKAKVLACLLFAFALILGFSFGTYGTKTVHAQTKIVIPKSWGACRSFWPGFIAFEASDGTVRITDTTGKVLEEIDRQ